MQLLDTRVTPAIPGMETYLVEFIGEGGESISVTLKDQTSEADFSSDGLIMKAKVMMVQVSAHFDDVPKQFENSAGDHEPTDANAHGINTESPDPSVSRLAGRLDVRKTGRHWRSSRKRD